MFYQGGPIDNCTHVPGPVAQYSAESEYTAACTTVMAPSHFRITNNEFLNKDPDLAPKQAPLNLLVKNQLCVWPKMARTTHTPETLPEECTL